VRTGVDQPVAVGRPPAEVTALDLGLSSHRRADPHADAVALALGDAAEYGNDQVVGLVVKVDRTADFRHPQRQLVRANSGKVLLNWLP
jgi:hypothetical protein